MKNTFPCLLEAFFRLFVDKKRHKKDKKRKKDTLGNDATSKRRLLIVDAKMKINSFFFARIIYTKILSPLVKMWFKEREFVSFLMIK